MQSNLTKAQIVKKSLTFILRVSILVMAGPIFHRRAFEEVRIDFCCDGKRASSSMLPLIPNDTKTSGRNVRASVAHHPPRKLTLDLTLYTYKIISIAVIAGRCARVVLR
jgi:hypothetical protein